MKTENLIKLYIAFFQSDNNSLIISNFFCSSVENRKVLEEEQLINGFLPYYPVDEEYALKTEKLLSYMKKKKSSYIFLYS